MHDEWHEAFASGRFHQRQGRATLTTPLTGQHAYLFAQHRLNAEAARGEPGSSVARSSSKSDAGPDLNLASNVTTQYPPKTHKRYRDVDDEDDDDSNEDSKSDPAFALLMLGAGSSEAALPVPPKKSKRRREGPESGSKRGSSHTSLSVSHAELEVQIRRQLQEQQMHLQAHMQQELQRVQQHMQLEFQQHIQRITGLTSGQDLSGAESSLPSFLPLYGQAVAQASSPGAIPSYYHPSSNPAPFTASNEQPIGNAVYSGLDFFSRSANSDNISRADAELHRAKSSAVATAAAAAAMAGATDMAQPAALATLLTGALMNSDVDSGSSKMSTPLEQALAGEVPHDWTATLALAALAKQNSAAELVSNPPKSPSPLA